MEKRKRPRKKIGEEQKSYIEIALPYPKDKRIKKDIIDLSESGLSFKMPEEEGYFLPGTPLKNIRIIKEKEIEEIEYAEVVYVSENDNNGSYYKIGIALKRLGKDYAAYKRNMRVFQKDGIERRKLTRYRISHPVRIESQDGREELAGNTLNISNKGLVLESPSDLLIGIEATILFLNLDIDIKGKVLWSAPADKDGYYHIAFVFNNPLKEIGIFGNYEEVCSNPPKTNILSEGLVEKGNRLGEVGKRWVKRARSLYFRTVSSPPSNHIIINGKELINFVSYNYLGLSVHPKVKEEAINIIKRYGTGVGAAPGSSGTTTLHNELENRLARFKGAASAAIFSSGFISNVYFLLSLLDMESIIICDEKSHASIMDGAVLSGAELRIFRHNDMQSLERILEYYPGWTKKLIAIDGVYSMDGDMCHLPEIYRLARRYNASIMIDEAHAIGVIGKNGHGVVEHFGLEGKIDFIIGTMSKALGNIGGFVACNKDIKMFLKIGIRANMFSTGLPPSICAGVLAALKVIEEEPELKIKLWHNINLMREGLRELDYNIEHTDSAIIPVIIGHEIKTYQLAKMLEDKYGIFMTPVTRPAVPRGSARLRLIITALHTDEDINYTLDIFKKIKKETGWI